MKNHLIAIVVLIATILTSCKSAPVVVDDLGSYNPDGVSEMELAVLNIDAGLYLKKIDDYEGNWSFYGDKGSSQILRIAPGVYQFEVLTDLQSSISSKSASIVVKIENSKRYLMIKKQESIIVGVNVIDAYLNESVVLNLNSMQQNRDNAHKIYYDYVVYPTESRLGYSIELESNDSMIRFKPDMVFTMVNKHSGVSISGRYLFKSGKVYLYETDVNSFSSEDFKNSNYAGIAQMIYEPVLCNGKSVRLKYEKPIEKRDSQEDFFILEIVN